MKHLKTFESCVNEGRPFFQETPNEYSSVLLIGHNPSMHESYEFLSGKLINKYPTCCLAALTYEGEWADIAQRSCDLDFIKKPRELR